MKITKTKFLDAFQQLAKQQVMVSNTLVRLSRSTLKENAMKDFLLSETMIKRVFMVAESISLLILQSEVVSGEQKKPLQNFGAQFMLLSTIILKVNFCLKFRLQKSLREFYLQQNWKILNSLKLFAQFFLQTFIEQ